MDEANYVVDVKWIKKFILIIDYNEYVVYFNLKFGDCKENKLGILTFLKFSKSKTNALNKFS